MSALISVIVPIYNGEQYIADCLDSVLAQTYKNIELLLIDDGSRDSSRTICREYCGRDKRIKLICRMHKGVSAARNIGIAQARGKYLFFLDIDDRIHPKLLEVLYRLQEKYQTFIATESRYYASGGVFQKPSDWDFPAEKFSKNIYLENKKAMKSLLWGDQQATLYVIGGKMIRRDMMGDVKFDEALSHGEDTKFLYCLIEKGGDVIVFPYDWYYYRRYDGSTSRIYSLQSIQSRYKAGKYIHNQEIKNNRVDNAIHWEEVMIDLLVQWYAQSRYSRDIIKRKYLRKLAYHEKKLRSFSQISRLRKIEFYLAFYCFPLYWIIHMFLACFRFCKKSNYRDKS